MKYFIADLHFYHKNVIRFSNRPFSDVEEMNGTLIQNWNRVVEPNDQVFILGDLFYHANIDQCNQTLKKLKGRKYLIRGNHESYLKQQDFDLTAFEWVKDYYEFKEDGQKWCLFHYPILEWNGVHNDSYHLYGHIHNNTPERFEQTLGPLAVNVGADMINFTPISIDEIDQLITSRLIKTDSDGE
jgi:Predicted phosphoesterase or phosphohydrolase